jgi:hypothetical protein
MDLVKAVLALVLLAVLGSAVAGCGATKERVLGRGEKVVLNPDWRTITVRGSEAGLQHVATGRLVTCRGWPADEGAQVPGSIDDSVEAEQSQAGMAGSPPSPLKDIVITRLPDGSVSVSCGSSK